MPTKIYRGEKFFDGWKSQPYKFENEEAKRQFSLVTNSERGNWVDWDLFHHIKRTAPELELTKEELIPRSKYNPEMLRPHCRKWEVGQSKELAYDSELLSLAMARVNRRFQLREKVKPIAFDEVPWKEDTNFGAPTFRNSKHYPDAQEKAIAGAKAVKRGKRPEPFTAYHRGKNADETRLVMAEPKEMFIIGGSFFYPYFNALSLQNSPYAGSTKRLAISARVNQLKWNSRFVLSADYSKYDSTIPQVLTSCAFKIVKNNFVMTEAEEKLWECYVTHFNTNGLLMPDGNVYYGRKGGVPSGAIFTSVIGSICNALLIEYAMLKTRGQMTDYLVLGDDCLIGTLNPVQVTEFAKHVSDFGIEVSLEDSELYTSQDDIYFLGHYWDNGVPRRFVNETIYRLVCPENVKPWNRAEFGSYDYCIGLFDKIKAYQNDNAYFWALGNKLIDSFLIPDMPWLWGKLHRRNYYYYNDMLDIEQYRETGIARALGEDRTLNNKSLRVRSVY